MDTPLVEYITESTKLSYHIGKDEDWTGYFVISGSGTISCSIDVALDGRGASASIHVLNAIRDNTTVTLTTSQRHASVDTKSNLIVKTVLYDHASFSFDGNIIVEPGADKTDAYQRNENLMLSAYATAVSRPSLEILADDVRCTHGATTGEIPVDQLWYLKTRGLDDRNAKRLFVEGFLVSGLGTRIPHDVSSDIVRRIMTV